MEKEIIDNLSGTLSEEATERILTKAIVWNGVVSICWAIVTIACTAIIAYIAYKYIT